MVKDYLGQKLQVGDTIVFSTTDNSNFVKGKIKFIGNDNYIIIITDNDYIIKKSSIDVIKIDTRTLDEIANDVEEKMTVMCGCLIVYEQLQISKDDIKPFYLLCDSCNKECSAKKIMFKKYSEED